MNISIEWIQAALYVTAGFGSVLGLFSIVWPARSITLYQWMMKCFNWKVEPINYTRELNTTRVFGMIIVALCGLMLAALLRPQLFESFEALSW